MFSASLRTASRSKRTNLPDRLVADEAAHILPAHQRNVLTKFGAIEFQQPAAVFAFLGDHFLEDLGGRGIIFAQTLGDVGVNPAILLLVRDREGKHFTFGEIGEIAHCGPMCAAYAERQAGVAPMRLSCRRSAAER